MHVIQDYRRSHISPGKGIEYWENFQQLPYLRYLWEWEQKILKQIIGLNFPDPAAIRHLDFATGTGRIIGYLEPMVGKSIGVDVSDEMLDVCKSNVRNSDIVKVDLTKKNIFADKQFDLITAFRFFLNAEEPLRNEALHVLANSLSPDGRLVFNVHMNKTSLAAVLKRFKRWVTKGTNQANALSIAEVTKMVTSHGLQIHDIYHFGVLPVVMRSKSLPIHLIDLIEKPASQLSGFKHISRQLIFVCERSE